MVKRLLTKLVSFKAYWKDLFLIFFIKVKRSRSLEQVQGRYKNIWKRVQPESEFKGWIIYQLKRELCHILRTHSSNYRCFDKLALLLKPKFIHNVYSWQFDKRNFKNSAALDKSERHGASFTRFLRKPRRLLAKLA